MGWFALPFSWVGDFLRWLSLMGGGWNLVAWGLYVAVCLSPLILVKWQRGWVRWLPVGMSGLLFWVVYLMVNPYAMGGGLRVFPVEVGLGLAGAAVWSAVLFWVGIWLVDRVWTADEKALARYLRGLLWGLVGVFGAAALWALWGMRGQVGGSLDGVFAGVRAVVAASPYGLNGWVALGGVKIARAVESGFFSDDMLRAVKDFSVRCKDALVAMLVISVGFNLLQFMLAARLSDVRMMLDFPVGSALFALGALLLARFAAHAHALREENEGFV